MIADDHRTSVRRDGGTEGAVARLITKQLRLFCPVHAVEAEHESRAVVDLVIPGPRRPQDRDVPGDGDIEVIDLALRILVWLMPPGLRPCGPVILIHIADRRLASLFSITEIMNRRHLNLVAGNGHNVPELNDVHFGCRAECILKLPVNAVKTKYVNLAQRIIVCQLCLRLADDGHISPHIDRRTEGAVSSNQLVLLLPRVADPSKRVRRTARSHDGGAARHRHRMAELVLAKKRRIVCGQLLLLGPTFCRFAEEVHRTVIMAHVIVLRSSYYDRVPIDVNGSSELITRRTIRSKELDPLGRDGAFRLALIKQVVAVDVRRTSLKKFTLIQAPVAIAIRALAFIRRVVAVAIKTCPVREVIRVSNAIGIAV